MVGELSVKMIGVLLSVLLSQGKSESTVVFCSGTDLAAVRICVETTSDDRIIRAETKDKQSRTILPGTSLALAKVTQVAGVRN